MSSGWVWTVAIIIAMGGALPARAACPARPSSATDMAQCSTLAAAGDAEAARQLGDALADPSTRFYEPATALSWWEQAAKDGDRLALRRLFDAHWYGRGTGKDPAKARTYLARAASDGAAWARLVRAFLAEADEPGLAAELYGGLAREGHCLAQLRLAHGHDRGGWVERNRSQALHWAVVAGSGGRLAPRPESHPLFDGRFNYRDCVTESFFLREDLGRGLGPEQRARVEESAASWKPGRTEARSVPAESPSTPPEPAAAPLGQVAKAPLPPLRAVPLGDWHPLPAALQRPAGKSRLNAEEVFATVGRSVLVVAAAMDEGDIKARRGRTGSAVAMDERTVVTNCHVIEGMNVIQLRQGSQTWRATPAGGDAQSDRCLMTVSPGRLSAVPGIRSWSELRVGETVYSIGAPKGLEATLGQGLISGLRQIRDTRYVQTSAPISQGSSGGGLFDASGNLVGITTFHVRDGDGLNFAIAAEDFFR